jgi:rod shape-determining protein MreC
VYLPDFFWKYRRTITLIVLVVFSLLIIIDSLHRRRIAHAGGELVQGITYPVRKASESSYDGARNVLSIIPDFFRTRTQNVALRKRVGELEQEVIALTEQLLEQRRLNDLTGFARQIEGRKVNARVIGANPEEWFSTVTVDRGESDGVTVYCPVVSSSGVAGYVAETFGWCSTVVLLTSSNSKVSVVSQRSRTRGVVQGDDRGGCMLKYVEPTADLQKGDVLVTWGGGIYPKGLVVGVVDELRNEPGNLFQWARVVPMTDVDKIEEVAIIIRDKAAQTVETEPADR